MTPRFFIRLHSAGNTSSWRGYSSPSDRLPTAGATQPHPGDVLGAPRSRSRLLPGSAYGPSLCTAVSPLWTLRPTPGPPSKTKWAQLFWSGVEYLHTRRRLWTVTDPGSLQADVEAQAGLYDRCHHLPRARPVIMCYDSLVWVPSLARELPAYLTITRSPGFTRSPGLPLATAALWSCLALSSRSCLFRHSPRAYVNVCCFSASKQSRQGLHTNPSRGSMASTHPVECEPLGLTATLKALFLCSTAGLT